MGEVVRKMRIESSFDHRKKCPDIQYTQFSYDEYGGFDVKIIAQNHTFFAHRWDQIRSFLSTWSSCNTQLKNYSQLCRWAKIWRITNMSSKWCQKIYYFSYFYFYTNILHIFLKIAIVCREFFPQISSTGENSFCLAIFSMFKVTVCQFYIFWSGHFFVKFTCLKICIYICTLKGHLRC